MKSGSDSSDWRKRENKADDYDFEQIDNAEFPCIIPASPNWYLSNILSCSNGYAVFGAKHSIAVLNLRTDPPVVQAHFQVCTSFSIKVTSVVIMYTEDITTWSQKPKYVGLACDDGLVRIFDVDERKIHKEHRKHKVKVNAVTWSPTSPSILVSGDEKGNISIWNYKESSLSLWTPIAAQMNTMLLSPITRNVLVAGYNNGNILVADISKPHIVSVLKDHHDEVTSLSWKPSADGRCLFASVSKDNVMRTWQANPPKALMTYSQPKNGSTKKKVDSQKGKAFLSLVWLDEEKILTSSASGDLIRYHVSNTRNSDHVRNGHNRLVFCIRKDVNTNLFVSVSMDRNIIIWDANTVRVKYKIATIGGFVYSLSISTVDPNLLAIGTGDNTVRTWSFGDHKNRYNFLMYWQQLQNAKVLVVAMHPNKEGLCAYGTVNGNVGVINVQNSKWEKSLTYHKNGVYSLCWGPSVEETDNSGRINCLYSVGQEGNIYSHKLGGLNNNAKDIVPIIKQFNGLKTMATPCEISWRSDYRYVAVGFNDGSISVMSSKLKCLVKLTLHKKTINCLAWHHLFEGEGDQNFSYWLASCSDDGPVCITDLSTYLKKDSPTVDIVTSPYRQLIGHADRTYRITWNPHKNGILASCSKDNTVQIWCVQENEGIANYREHNGRVQTVLWSYNDSDLVYSGGEDFTLRRWRICEQIHKLPPTTKPKSKRKKAKQSNNTVTTSSSEEIARIPPSVERDRVHDDVSRKEDEIFTMDDENLNVNIVSQRDQRKKKQKSLFKKSAVKDSQKKEVMQEDCVLLARYLKAEVDSPGLGHQQVGIHPGSDDCVNLGLYTNRKDMFDLAECECQVLNENNHQDQLIQLEVWRSNIGGMLDEAVENKSLTDMMIALSPLGGQDMWKAAMFCYAEQLEEKRNFHLAALCYVALGEIHQAIQIFKDNNFYREAVVLAKLRLAENDPIIKELFHSWALKHIRDLNFENAAKCYLAIGCVEDAVTALAKRGDAASLYTAVRVANVYKRSDLVIRYFSHCVEALISEMKWNKCHEMLNPAENVEKQIYYLQAIVGERFVLHMKDSNLVTTELLENHEENSYLIGKKINPLSYVKIWDVDGNGSLLYDILSLMESELNITPATIKLDETATKQLDKPVSSVNKQSNIEILRYVWNQVLLGVINLLYYNCDGTWKHFLKAFEMLAQTGYTYSLILLFRALFPKYNNSFQHLIRLFGGNTSKNRNRTCYTNFHAYMHVGVLYQVWWNLSTTLRKLNRTILLEGSMKISSNQGTSTANPSARFASVLESIQQLTFIESPYNSNNMKNFVNFSSTFLMSETHVSYQRLVHELNFVNQKIAEVKLRNRLKDHIASKERKKRSLSEDVVCCLNDVLDEVIKTVEDNKQCQAFTEKELEYQKTTIVSELSRYPIDVQV